MQRKDKFTFFSPYNVKKWIVRWLQHRAKAIRCDTNAYQEEKIGLRYNFHPSNYPESITSALKNMDHMTQNKIRTIITVRVPYVKGLTENIQKIWRASNIRTIFKSGSTLQTLFFRVKIPVKYMTNEVHKSEICCTLKVKLEEHWKTVLRGEIVKSGMADHQWTEKGKLSAIIGWSQNNSSCLNFGDESWWFLS